MATTLSDVLEFIRGGRMSPTDRSCIVDALNSQTRAKRAQAKAGLRQGMRVQFFSNRTGRDVFGRITKVNWVNVDLVEEGNGMRWRVSPQLLKPVNADGKLVEEDEF